MEQKFARYDPETMDPDDYLAVDDPDNYDLRVVSVLTGVFNPLVSEFAQKVGPDLPEKLEGTFLTGDEPILGTYVRYPNRQGNLYPSIKLLPFTEYYLSGQQISSIISPVGDYGHDFALANVQAARSLYSLLDQTMNAACHEVNKDHGWLLIEETHHKESMRTLQEAVQTTTAIIGVLTSQKVEQFEENPVSLCRKLVTDGIVNQFAALASMGQVFPLASDGFYFDRPLIQNETRFAMRNEIHDALRDEHGNALEKARNGTRGRGCPAAHKTIERETEVRSMVKDSGVNMLASIYVDCVDYFYDRSSVPSESTI